MGHPSGEKQSHDYPEELIAARAELAFKVCLRLIFQTNEDKWTMQVFIDWARSELIVATTDWMLGKKSKVVILKSL